jgi:hypothetical protein
LGLRALSSGPRKKISGLLKLMKKPGLQRSKISSEQLKPISYPSILLLMLKVTMAC